MPPIVLREAGEQDAAVIARLHADSWCSAYREFLSQDYLDNHAHAERAAVWMARFSSRGQNPFFAILAEMDGQPVGFVCVFPNESPVFGSFLDNLHVLPHLAGRGIGRQLMNEAARRLLAQETHGGFYLWVIEQNSRARRFYAKAGGVEVERAILAMPDGSKVAEMRCHWPNPAILLR